MKISILSCLFLSLFLLSACRSTREDPFLDVPEFEIRNFSFVNSRKTLSPAQNPHSYVTRWNILGPVKPLSGDVEKPVLENEPLLCGRMEAPDDALWHVRIFKNTQKNKRAAGFCSWTATLQKYQGKQLFYACSTFLSGEEYKGVQIHLLAAGSAVLYWNGKQIGTLKKPNYPAGKELLLKDLTIRKGGNRLVLKYLDGEKTSALRGVSVRFSLPEKHPLSGKTALIR